jgi:DHA1 family bicyclomycin/chloramphenicol resistance-like MFS transporter
LQAIGGSGAIVLARTVVRDMFHGVYIGREMARVSSIMGLAPLVAPLIGGVLQTAFGWRSNFLALVCYGGACWVLVWFLLPETLRQRAPEPVSFLSMMRSYRRFLREPSFVVHLGIVACCMCGLFAWISSASFVLQDLYGLSALVFGIAFAIGSSGYLLGTTIAARFVVHWGARRTIGLGAASMAASGVVMALLLAIAPHWGYGLIVAIGLYTTGMGMTLAQAQAGALLPFPDRAGAASSLVGSISQTLSAGVGAIIGHVLGTTAWPLAIAILLAGGLSLLFGVLGRSVSAGRTAG